MLKTGTLLVCLGLFCSWVAAQEDQVFEIDHTIASSAFGDDRKITVYLPPSYYKRPYEQYTVTYVLDGHYDPFIDLVVKTIEYGVNAYKYTPTIVVGIHAKNRGREFSAPPSGSDLSRDEHQGKAPALRQHLAKEVIPLIDSLYDRTLDFRTLMGHSSGGKFVLYTLFSDYQDLFDAYIGISPGLRPGTNEIVETAAAHLKVGRQFPKFLYCTTGTVGDREEIFGAAMSRLDSVLQVYPNHGLIWQNVTLEGLGHWTVVSASVSESMLSLTRHLRVDEKLFYDFARDDSQSMKEHLTAFYQASEDFFGFQEIPYAGYIVTSADYLVDKGLRQAALEVLNWAREHYPDHYNLNKQRAILLLEMGNKPQAREALTRSIELLEGKREEKGESDYRRELERLQARLEQTN